MAHTTVKISELPSASPADITSNLDLLPIVVSGSLATATTRHITVDNLFGAATHITASGNVSGSATSTSSFGFVRASNIGGNSPLIISDVTEINFGSSPALRGNPIFHGDINIVSQSFILDAEDNQIIGSNDIQGAAGLITFGGGGSRSRLQGLNIQLGASATQHVTASGDISASGDITANNLTLSGDATINGNLTFGNSTSDSVSFGAEISSSIIPDANNSYDLGSSGKQWKDLYVDGTSNLDVVSASVGIQAAHAQIAGVARIGIANVGFIQGIDGAPTSVKIGSASIDNISSSLIPDLDDTYDLGSSTKQWKDLHIDGTANIDTLSVPGVSTLGIANVGFIQGVGGAPTSVKIGSASIDNVSSSLTPDLDNTYDLGSSTKQWKDLYIDGTANIDSASIDVLVVNSDVSSNLIPDITNQFDLGSPAKQWKDLYIDGTANIDFVTASNGLLAPILKSTVATIAIANIGFIQGAGGAPTSVKIGSASIDNVSSSIIPDLDNTYDLGSSTKQWKDLHINGTAHIDTISGVTNITSTSASISYISSSSPTVFAGAIEPDTDDSNDIGSSTKQWRNLFVDGTANIDTVGNGVSIPSISSSIDISGSITPRKSTTGKSIHDLGSSAKQWRDLYINGAAYIDQLSGSGTAGDSAITASVNIVPGVDDTYDLGSSAKQWKDLYIDGTANIDSASIDTADINGGTIDGITSLTAGNDLDIGAHDLRAATLTADGLTSGRVVFAGTNGVLSDDADLTFATSNNLLSATHITATSITSSIISASGNISTSANVTAASLTLDQNIQSAANTDAAFYSINGKRGEIRSQLQTACAADTGFTLELRNTSIAANSLVIVSVIAPSADALSSGGIVSGSVVCGNVIAANTASINFFNTGVALLDNSKFTASFAVL
tara:strand:- start:529 stop:3231 length:2703 start_codon:yes stop_codon:yes gene_type:complete